MHTNTATKSNNNETGTWTRRVRIGCVAFVIVGTAGIGGFVAGSQDSAAAASSTPASTHSQSTSYSAAAGPSLAQFAVRNNLTGLSPASLGPAPAAALAQFAAQNNLTGLSPASLAPAPTE